jgi:hypothetical protein
MASKLEIWNLALINLSQTPSIAGPNEDSTEANLCRNIYDTARREVLQAHDWNFARKREALGLIIDDRNREDWEYQYGYPGDCLQARQIINQGTGANTVRSSYMIPFKVTILPSTGLEDSFDQRVIWTDQKDAVLEYTYDQGDPTFFSAHFITTLAWCMAKYIAKPLTNKSTERENAMQMYVLSLNAARASNMNEAREVKQADKRNAFTDAHF